MQQLATFEKCERFEAKAEAILAGLFVLSRREKGRCFILKMSTSGSLSGKRTRIVCRRCAMGIVTNEAGVK